MSTLSKNITDFYERINSVTGKFLNCSVNLIKNDKVIHDPIWGSVVYNSWEMQIIDTPLFQRMRKIHQLGMAEYTYPAAKHSRYEHSLGTVAIASKMYDRLKSRHANTPLGELLDLNDSEKYLVRLAALLHDIGHCVYSHLSEGIYGQMASFREMRDHINKKYDNMINPKPHELMSFLIITSDAFLDFFYEKIDYPNKGDRDNCRSILQAAANIVIGANNKGVDSKGNEIYKSYLTDIINNDFDADKLDYTQRDSYTAGIAMNYGVDHFLLKLRICKDKADGIDEYRLAVTKDALITIEELIFNRNILYTYMYRHQKVLATEEVIRDCLEGLIATERIKHPCDFLSLSELDIDELGKDDCCPFQKYGSNISFHSIMNRINSRDLPKRCLVIDKEFFDNETEKIDRLVEEYSVKIKGGDIKEKLLEFGEKFNGIKATGTTVEHIKSFVSLFKLKDFHENYLENRNKWLDIIKRIYKEKGKNSDEIDCLDLFIVVPDISASKLLLSVVTKEGEAVDAKSFSYINNWSDSFHADKWRGYFFITDKVDADIAAKAAIELIEKLKNNKLQEQ